MMKQGMTLVMSVLLAGAVFSQNAEPTILLETPGGDTGTIFKKVDVPAEYPGGVQGWVNYVSANLRYPKKAQRKQVEGTVKVQFVIDKNGYVSQVAALNDPGYGLAEEAIRVIRESGRWKPAMQNGRPVIYRHVQSLTFKLE